MAFWVDVIKVREFLWEAHRIVQQWIIQYQSSVTISLLVARQNKQQLSQFSIFASSHRHTKAPCFFFFFIFFSWESWFDWFQSSTSFVGRGGIVTSSKGIIRGGKQYTKERGIHQREKSLFFLLNMAIIILIINSMSSSVSRYIINKDYKLKNKSII